MENENQSRIEEQLYSALNDEQYADEPQSRIESLIKELLEQGAGGGSGGGPSFPSKTNASPYDFLALDGSKNIAWRNIIKSNSEIRLDSNGKLIFSTPSINVSHLAAMLVAYLFDFNMSVSRVLIDNGDYSDSELGSMFEDYNMSVIDRSTGFFIFVPARSRASWPYYDEDYNDMTMSITSGYCYVFSMNDNDELVIDHYSGNNLRKFLINGNGESMEDRIGALETWKSSFVNGDEVSY